MVEKTRETNNMQLLQDTFIIEQLQVMNEGKADGPMKIRGVFGRCNEKNNNGRIYPTAVLESQLKKVQPLISERRLCGELDHPQNDTVKLGNASHLITKLDMKGDELVGEAEILKTPAGLTAKALVEGGVKIGISSRGMGTLSEDHNGDKIVNEDFRLVTFDLVADPSTRGAYPGLAESTESKFVQESQSKLKKESNFVTMLESKMRDAYTPWIEEAKTKTKKKKAKKNLPGNQEAIDADGDGKIEASDFEKLRGEAFELVKADGIWHRFAEALIGEVSVTHPSGKTTEVTPEQAKNRADLAKRQQAGTAPRAAKPKNPKAELHKRSTAAGKEMKGPGERPGKLKEAFADELDKESQRTLQKNTPAKDSGSMMGNFRARRHAKGMEVAAARGRTKGKDIEQKGEIVRGRRMEKAKAAAAAGKPVTGGEKVAAGAKAAAGKAADLAKGAAALPGKAIDTAVKVSDAATKAKIVNQRGNVQRANAKKNIADRRAAKGPKNAPKPTAGKPTAEAPASGKRPSAPVSKSGTDINPELQKRFNKIKSKQGSSRQSLATTRKRMTTTGQLSRPGEGGDISASRAYKQIGFMLAEMLGLKA